jgi:cell division protein FtsW
MYVFLGAALFLAFAGLVMVFSAAFVSDLLTHGDTAHTLKRQLIYVAAGVGLVWVLARTDYRVLRRHAWLLVAFADALLIAVLAVGAEAGGSTRWIDLGPATLQPSEFAKIACILGLAVVMTDRRIRDENQRLMRVAMILPPILALVMFEPDMGTAMAILVASFTVLWLGGLSWKRTLTLVGMGAGFTAVGITIAPYRVERWLAFRDPWADPFGSGYQSVQAIMALASGGLTGVGLGMSRQKYSYLPEAHTDFILAIIGEELGLIGTLAVVAAFITLAVAGFRIAVAARDPLGRLLAGGLTAMIVTQALINMLAVTNLMPVTGIPLPLVSFGGNSMLATMIAVGLVVSVARHGGAPAAETATAKGGDHARADERRRHRGTHLPRAVRRRGARIQRA